MKKWILFLLLLCVGCSGGLTRIADSERSIRITSDMAGLTAEELVSEVSVWMETHFTATQTPIAFADRIGGVIVGQGQIDYPCSGLACMNRGGWNVSFDMHLKQLDGQLEVIYRNINLISPDTNAHPGMVGPVWSKRDMDAIRPVLADLFRTLVQDLDPQR